MNALPPRRLNITEKIVFRGNRWLFSVGFDHQGQVREVFLNGGKHGTDMEHLMADGCYLISKLLQSGVDISDLRGKMGQLGKEGASETVNAGSFIGFLIATAQAMEEKHGPYFAEVYALQGGNPKFQEMAAEANEGAGE